MYDVIVVVLFYLSTVTNYKRQILILKRFALSVSKNIMFFVLVGGGQNFTSHEKGFFLILSLTEIIRTK